MSFPETPTCHEADVHATFRIPERVWREPERTREPYGEDFRRCSYCGSIHPEDLLRHLDAGATLHGADWKYGWPHKFYVDGIPNLHPPDKLVNAGATYETQPDGTTKETPILRPAPKTVTAKWYNLHFLDAGWDPHARTRLLDRVYELAGIRFKVDGDKLGYAAPYRGYQR